jgi:hypothetical protein
MAQQTPTRPLPLAKCTGFTGQPLLRESRGERAITLSNVVRVVNEVSAGTCGGRFQSIFDGPTYVACYHSVARLFTCGQFVHCTECVDWDLLVRAFSDTDFIRDVSEPDTYIVCPRCSETMSAITRSHP